MNLNDLAVKVTKLEGKKKSVNVAQVKEVLSCLFRLLAKESDAEVLKVVHRYRAKNKKKQRRRCPGW